jgi:hypothetical protein
MTFAQALARIEELIKLDVRSMDMDKLQEFTYLLHDHADSIVQLGKMAQEMRNAQVSGIQGDMFLAIRAYDKLMKGDDK